MAYYKDDKLETSCTIQNARIEYVFDIKGKHKQKNDKEKPFEWEDTIRGESIEMLFYDLCKKLQGYESVEINIEEGKKNATPIQIVNYMNEKALKFMKKIPNKLKKDD